MYAITTQGPRSAATPGGKGLCPVCWDGVRAKCGRIVSWHWAHINRDDCDPWAERDTAWHRRWQQQVPEAQREVVVGNHRADVLAHNGTYVELQHSPLSVDEIRARETFYGRMIWIFDAVEAYDSGRLNLRYNNKKPYLTFRWKHPRKSVAACRRPVLLDLGNGALFNIGRIYTEAPCGGWGKLAGETGVINWMNTGANPKLYP